MSDAPHVPGLLATQIADLLCRGTYAARLELSRIAAGLRLDELRALPADVVAKLERAVLS